MNFSGSSAHSISSEKGDKETRSKAFHTGPCSPRRADFLGILGGRTPLSWCPLVLLEECLSLSQSMCTDLDRWAERGVSSDQEPRHQCVHLKMVRDPLGHNAQTSSSAFLLLGTFLLPLFLGHRFLGVTRQ